MNEDWLEESREKFRKESGVVDKLTFESLKRHKRDVIESLEAMRKLLKLFPQSYTTNQQLAVLQTKAERLELPTLEVENDKIQTSPQG